MDRVDYHLYPDGLLLLAAAVLLYQESTRTPHAVMRGLCVGLSIFCGIAGSIRMVVVALKFLERLF